MKVAECETNKNDMYPRLLGVLDGRLRLALDLSTQKLQFNIRFGKGLCVLLQLVECDVRVLVCFAQLGPQPRAFIFQACLHCRVAIASRLKHLYAFMLLTNCHA